MSNRKKAKVPKATRAATKAAKRRPAKAGRKKVGGRKAVTRRKTFRKAATSLELGREARSQNFDPTAVCRICNERKPLSPRSPCRVCLAIHKGYGESIMGVISGEFGIPTAQIRARSPRRGIHAIVRRLCVWCIRRATDLAWNDIAKLLNRVGPGSMIQSYHVVGGKSWESMRSQAMAALAKKGFPDLNVIPATGPIIEAAGETGVAEVEAEAEASNGDAVAAEVVEVMDSDGDDLVEVNHAEDLT